MKGDRATAANEQRARDRSLVRHSARHRPHRERRTCDLELERWPRTLIVPNLLRAPVGTNVIRSADDEVIGGAGDLEQPVVMRVVTRRAYEHEVREVVPAAVLAMHDVVDLEPVGRSITRQSLSILIMFQLYHALFRCDLVRSHARNAIPRRENAFELETERSDQDVASHCI